jgi:hypothetical protein
MIDAPVLEPEEEVSAFSKRLRDSALERSEALERERQWLQQQLDDLRTKAIAEPGRGWSGRRAIRI